MPFYEDESRAFISLNK